MKAGVIPLPDARGSVAAPTHPNPIVLYTLISLMQLFWTANFLIGKVALREFPALLLAGLRVIVAFLCVLPFYLWKVHGKGRWTKQDLPTLIRLGFLGIGINQVFFILGLSKTSVAHSSIMISTTPICVLFMAAARGLERITLRKVAGMLAAVAGVAMLAMEHRGGPGPTVTGDLMTLAAASAFALYTVLGKEVNHRYDALTVNTFLYGSGALFVLPIVLWQGWSFAFSQVSTVGWLALVYTGVFPSLVCYLIFYYALGFISASRLTTIAYVQPVFATLLGVLFFGEQITVPLILGGAIIFTGIYLTQRD